MTKLKGKKIAVLVDQGFEQVELTEPVKALKEQEATVHIISKESKVRGWKMTEWGDELQTDVLLDKADPAAYDGLLLPGGVMNPDRLRMNPKAVEFVQHFTNAAKPIAAICHGPWILIETGILRGRRVTSYPSIKTDLKNAGAEWINQEVVTDRGLVTSRSPEDLVAFNKKMVEEFAEGQHQKLKVDDTRTSVGSAPSNKNISGTSSIGKAPSYNTSEEELKNKFNVNKKG